MMMLDGLIIDSDFLTSTSSLLRSAQNTAQEFGLPVSAKNIRDIEELAPSEWIKHLFPHLPECIHPYAHAVLIRQHTQSPQTNHHRLWQNLGKKHSLYLLSSLSESETELLVEASELEHVLSDYIFLQKDKMTALKSLLFRNDLRKALYLSPRLEDQQWADQLGIDFLCLDHLERLPEEKIYSSTTAA